MQDEKKDLVTTMGMSQEEFGAALVTEAQNRKQKQRLEKSVAVAQTILSSIEECDKQIEYFAGWKRTREGQLKALQDGKFSFNKSDDLVYDEETLNRK